jgi:hypothetical protein
MELDRQDARLPVPKTIFAQFAQWARHEENLIAQRFAQ